MLVSKAARRYAHALLELAIEQKTVEDTLRDILLVKNTVAGSRDLELFLKSPVIKPAEKHKALDSIFKERLGALATQFLSLIARKERAALLHEIATAFAEEYNSWAGIVEAEVHTAAPLTEAQISALKQALEQSTSKTVHLDIQIEPELKGGLLVKILDTVIDGSVKHKLEQLQQKLLADAVELK